MGHDFMMDLKKSRQQAAAVNPEFNALTQDLDAVLKSVKDPVTIGVLLFQLAQERKTTNEVLARIEQKLDALANQETTAMSNPNPPVQFLPEADKRILFIVEQTGGCSASEVQTELGYKGTNAASQRLNALVKQGLIQKVQAGKKVYFTTAKFGLAQK